MVFSGRSELALTHHGSFHQVNGAMVRCDKTSQVFHHRGNSFTTLLWARHTSRAPTQLRRPFDDLFPSKPQGPPRPHVNFKTFADAAPTILTIGVLSAKR